MKIKRGKTFAIPFIQSKVSKDIIAIYDPITMLWHIYKGEELVLSLEAPKLGYIIE